MTASFASRKAHARAGATYIEASITAANATIEAARVARAAEVTAARQAEKDRHRFTRDEILLATHVLTPWRAWAKVITVNKVTVTVLSPYGFKETVKFDQIRAVTA